MFAVPMRPYLQTQNREACTSTDDRSPVKQEAAPSTMSFDVRAPPRLAIPKRPKLSLQTATIPQPFAPRSANALSIGTTTDSPTARNTYENALKASPSIPPPPSGSPTHRSRPGNSPSPLSSGEYSPAPPYHLPIGARSILRNSPLPPRFVTATSTRAPYRMFPPTKRVTFKERIVELTPVPTVEESDPSDTDSDSSTSKRKRAQATTPTEKEDSDDPEDMPATPVQGRCKRRREWVWTIGNLEDGCISPNVASTFPNDTSDPTGDDRRTASADGESTAGFTRPEPLAVVLPPLSFSQRVSQQARKEAASFAAKDSHGTDNQGF
ncbi:hypothetical protein MMC19_007401 [Ptychographa xylographoides]|nr:hypothetical protein [Ptychographa xylographoides]